MTKLGNAVRLGSLLTQIVAFFVGIAGVIGFVANGLFAYAFGWAVLIVLVFVVFSRLDHRMQRAKIADVVREVDDPVLGKLVFDEDNAAWAATVALGGDELTFMIGGDKRPSRELVEQAKRLVGDHAALRARMAAFVEREAPKMEGYAEAARGIALHEIWLTDARKPNAGMVTFHNAERDPDGPAFRCDLIDGEPRDLAVDT